MNNLGLFATDLQVDLWVLTQAPSGPTTQRQCIRTALLQLVRLHW